MGLISENIFSFIKHCNMFTSPVNLRYKLNQDYNTFAGGLVSIFLVMLLIVIFYSSWVSLVNKTDISVSLVTSKELEPSHFQINSDEFMFAVGVMGINLSDFSQKQYFNFTMKKIQMVTEAGVRNYYETPFQLEGCQMSHWQQLGPVFVQRFKRLDLTTFLCPPRNTILEIGGKWTSQKFTYFEIKFDKCKGDNCRSQAEIDDYLKIFKSFFIDFFYSNTLLNPDQSKPISMLLEDKDYAMCSPKISVETNIYLSEYSMTTDQSIFPWFDNVQKKGFLIDRGEREMFNTIPGQNDPYYRLYLRKSDVMLDVNRKFKKMDEMLSYIGGLLGIIVLALGFLLKYYGQCAFELEMCQKIFDYHNKKQLQESRQQQQTKLILQTDSNLKDETPEKKKQAEKVIEPKDFDFLDFLVYILIYVPFMKICKIRWKKMEVYEESLEEMRYKLDISQLMEKLNFYDRSVNALFDENQLKLLYLQQKFHFQEVRQERKMLSFREGINARLFEEPEQSAAETQGKLSSKEHKKSLRQIADFSTKKKVKTFLHLPVNEAINLNFKEDFDGVTKNENTQLTGEIKKALKKLDDRIEKGDVVSTRIYNGLQYELLEAYEKSKANEKAYHFFPVTRIDSGKKRKIAVGNSAKINIESINSLVDNQNSMVVGKESGRGNQEYFYGSMEEQ